MTPPSSDQLDREGRALIRYLTKGAASDYLLDCYRRGRSSPTNPADSAIDRLLLEAAARSRVLARLGDGYARIVHPTGGYRRRLTLMVAILENAPETHRHFNSASTGPGAAVWVGVVASLLLGAASLVVGLVLFGPIDLVIGRAGRGSRS